MFTILMRNDKSLFKRNEIRLYQREKLVDKIRFLIPFQYEDFELSKFKVLLKYIDQGNVAQTEELVASDEPYNDTLQCYCLPVDTKLTRFAGDITIHLTFNHVDIDTGVSYVLHTGETTITILPVRDIYAFVSDESLEVIDQKILELDAKIQAADMLIDAAVENQVDDLMITDSLLQVSSNGRPIGAGVNIVVPSINDGDIDGKEDGILDLDSTIKVPPSSDDNSDTDINEDDNWFVEL